MEELYSVMREFLEVEYNQESLLHLLKAAGTAFDDDKQKDTKLIINSTEYYLNSLQKELKTTINKLDSYIVKESTKK